MPRATAAELDDRYGEVVAKYNSTRNPENVYEVRRKGEALSCLCPGWRFSRERPRTCRHVKRVIAGLDDDAALVEKATRATALQRVLAAAGLTISQRHTGLSLFGVLASGRLFESAIAALDASGLFAPRAVKPDVVRSRGARLITLDDD